VTIESVIRDDWASKPIVMEACLNIWHALSARAYQLDHYTFGELAELAKANDEVLTSTVLLYLASPKLKVLKTCLMYEFADGIFELPEDEVAHYANGDDVIHPDSGEPIPESEILVCFTPGPRLLQEGRT